MKSGSRRNWSSELRLARLACALLLLGLSRASAEPGRDVVGAAVRRALTVAPRVRVIVALREPEASLRSLTARAGAIAAVQDDVLRRLAPDDFSVTQRWQAIGGLAGLVSANGLSELERHPDVQRVDLDVPMFPGLAEAVPLVGADRAHAAGVTGRGVVVAVLDTGVESSHPDLKDHVIGEQCFCSAMDGGGCCPSGATSQAGAGSARDDDGHGTNVAGIITSAGRLAPLGVAPDAEIVAVKVLGRLASGSSTAGFISGLDWLLAARPDVKVVNVSAGTGELFAGVCDSASAFTLAMASAAKTLRARGTILFAASLNNGSPSQLAAPACVTGYAAVGAVYDAAAGRVSFGCTDATTASDQVACFSNASSKLALLAPGGPMTAPGLGGGTSTYVGTSQACPVAAAAATLLLEARPGMSPDQVEAALESSGVSVSDPRNGQRYPRVDVNRALR